MSVQIKGGVERGGGGRSRCTGGERGRERMMRPVGNRDTDIRTDRQSRALRSCWLSAPLWSGYPSSPVLGFSRGFSYP